VIAFLLLTGSKEPTARRLTGTTAGGKTVTIVLRDDRPVRFYSAVAVSCGRGSGYQQNFVLADDDVPFRVDGDRLTVRETWVNDYGRGWVGRGTTAVDARFDGDSATGTISTRQPITGPGAPYVCESARVTFSAHAQR
jgi:hypothetical protein